MTNPIIAIDNFITLPANKGIESEAKNTKDKLAKKSDNLSSCFLFNFGNFMLNKL